MLQEQQRVAADPGTRSSFLFARCRAMQPRCGGARVAGTVVWPAADAADTALGN